MASRIADSRLVTPDSCILNWSCYDRRCHHLHFDREKAYPQELRKTRSRAERAIPPGYAARLLHRVPASGGAAREAQERRAAGGLYLDFSDREPFEECAPGFRQLRAGRAAVRCQGVPAARPYLRQPAA